MDSATEHIFDIARQRAVTAESDEALAIVTALEGLATEIHQLRKAIERTQQ